ncbi:MAG: TlpA disulfide reductase family protein [Betaproteobacteria bacterium]
MNRRHLLQALAATLAAPALTAQAQFSRQLWPQAQATPVIDLQDLQGQRWSTAALGGKAVLLNFWATWCAPCKEELPSLQTLHEMSGAQLQVLAINVRETASHVRRYLQATGLSLPVVLDGQGDLARRWGVTVYPTTVLIAADGRARGRVRGEVDWTGREPAQWLASLAAAPR